MTTGESSSSIFFWTLYRRGPEGCIQTQLLSYRLLALCRSRPPKTSTSMFWFDTSHLTVDGQRNLLLPGSYARDHGAANVFPSILLPHGLQCQEVLVAKNLRREKKEVRRSQRSLDAMTAEHLRYQQSNAEVVGKKKEKNKLPEHFIP